MALWTDVAATPAAGYEGLLVEQTPGGTNSYVAEAAVRAGFAVAYGTDRLGGQNQVLPLPAALAVADPNSIALGIASTVVGAAVTGVGAGALDGALSIGRLYPAQAVTLGFDADAGWDTALGFLVCEVYGDDAMGRPISEQFIRNNAGAVAVDLVSRQCFSRVRQVDIGASNAATGTLLVGTDPTLHALSAWDFPGIACYDLAREPSAVAAVTFDANETLACVREGIVWAVCVDGCLPGEPVFVRTTAGGGVLRGALYGPQVVAPGGAFAPYLGAQWITQAGALGLAQIRIGGR